MAPRNGQGLSRPQPYLRNMDDQNGLPQGEKWRLIIRVVILASWVAGLIALAYRHGGDSIEYLKGLFE